MKTTKNLTGRRRTAGALLAPLAGWLALSAQPATGHAQSVRSFIENVDLKCYKIEGDLTSLDLPLVLNHLNPVLRDMGVPPENVMVREPQQLCVPVAKNQRFPPADVRPIIEYLDLKCYRIESDSQIFGLPLRLDHINPVLREMGAPVENVRLLNAQQLCVPVAKNGRIPPDPIVRYIEQMDLECYGIQSDIPFLGLPLQLDHLNPVLLEMGAPRENVRMRDPQQLCLPVSKNDRMPPPDILPFVQYLDIKKYAIDSDITFLGIPLRLDHLNPLFIEIGLAPEDIIVTVPQQLGVPVVKNLRFPPF